MQQCKKKYHVVVRGKKIGIHQNYDIANECATTGKKGARKSYNDLESAKKYFEDHVGKIKVPMYNKQGILLNAEEKPSSKNITEQLILKKGKTCKIYVDGSFRNQRTGIGLVIFENTGKEINVSKTLEHKTFGRFKNDGAELMSSLYAMEWAKRNNYETINIFYDNQGIENFALKEPSDKSNEIRKEYYKRYKEYSKDMLINFVHVQAHKQNRYNNKADLLAKLATA